MVEIIDAVGRYGLPTVAAAIILWLYIRGQQHQEARLDRWETRLLGDNNGTKGALWEIQRDVRELREEMREQRDLLESRPCVMGYECVEDSETAATA